MIIYFYYIELHGRPKKPWFFALPTQVFKVYSYFSIDSLLFKSESVFEQ